MIKYRLYRDTFEFRARTIGHKTTDEDGIECDEVLPEEIENRYLETTWCYPEFREEFNTMEDALKSLCTEPVTTHAECGNSFTLIKGRLSFVQSEELDDDGELIDVPEMHFKSAGCRW